MALLAFVPLARPSADDYFPPPDAKGGWRTLSDPAKIAKTAGVDKQKLDEAFEYVLSVPGRLTLSDPPMQPGMRLVEMDARGRLTEEPPGTASA